MSLSNWMLGIAGVAAGAAIICNLPSRIWLPAERATLKYLAASKLQTLDKAKKFQEAQGLSSLKPQLSSQGFNLYAVVHETKGVEEFRPYFDGEIFLDEERRFYGPKERWLGLSGFVRVSFWRSVYRVYQKGVDGNLKGEGRLLGGVFVVGKGDEGILFEHREGDFGDHANLTDVMDAVKGLSKKSN